MLSTTFVTGSPNWIDLGAPDTEAAAAFYGAVFGWEFQSAGPEAGGYGFFQQDGKTVAALGPLTEEGARPAWTIYFRTPDADATAKAVEQAGGTVRSAPFDVFDAGRMAQFTDASGAEFAVWQPARTKGFEVAGVPNSLFWAELHVADQTAGAEFYGSVFGWRAAQAPMEGMTYLILSTAEGDQQDTSFGGVAPLVEGEPTATWVPYFQVEDADATVAAAQANGGTVLMPAADLPGVGRMAWLADRAGAVFAIIKPQPFEG